MQTKELLALIEAHPASSHRVFEKLASRRLSPPVLTQFLREMGAFCHASRDGGGMSSTLSILNLRLQARIIKDIFESEVGHGETFAQMAMTLLQEESSAAREKWRHLWNSPEETREHSLGMLWWPNPPSVEVQAAAKIFHARRNKDYSEILYSVGAMFPLEWAAHRQIIPGEVAAFVESGFYARRSFSTSEGGVAFYEDLPLTLADLPYLREHAGETGAEHDHEVAMVALISGWPGLSADQEGEILTGCADMLGALVRLYDRLEAIIATATP